MRWPVSTQRLRSDRILRRRIAGAATRSHLNAAERRILVILRNAGCNAVPHPNDFVFDSNPLLRGPYPTEDGPPWTYDDEPMIDAEPYLVMEAVDGASLEHMLPEQPDGPLPDSATLTSRPIRMFSKRIAGTRRQSPSWSPACPRR